MTRSVAVVRGEALNPFELQSYAGLPGRYRAVGIGATDGHYDLAGIKPHVRLLRPRAHGRIGARLMGDNARRLRGLPRVLRGFDLVHSAETFTPFSEQVADLRPRARFKFVLTCWETLPFLHDDSVFMARRKRKVRNAVDLFLPVTALARDALLSENVPADKICVQPVGVDRTRFRPRAKDTRLLRDWRIPEDVPVILYCGRLIREKGVLDLVLALEQTDRAILVLAGLGPERSRLEAASEARKLTQRIRFVGACGYGAMPFLYAAADLFCLPSVPTPYWEEQFGMVLIEAMACGVPIVATTTGAIPEVLGEVGRLVPPHAPNELAAAFTHLLTNRAARENQAAAGLRRAERFDAAVVGTQIANRYDEVLG